jgi:hypothetical protein
MPPLLLSPTTVASGFPCGDIIVSSILVVRPLDNRGATTFYYLLFTVHCLPFSFHRAPFTFLPMGVRIG